MVHHLRRPYQLAATLHVAGDLQLKTMKTVALEKATPANCGAKAAACAALAKVAAGASFSTPAGVCLPFGTMDAAIKVPHLPVGQDMGILG